MKPFEAEQWMTRFEKQAEYNLADTSLPAIHLTPDEIEEILLDYGEIDGSLKLRESIARLYRHANPNEFITTTGCSQANALVMESLLGPGDEVIVFVPDYLQFDRIARRLGCTVKPLFTDENGQFDPEELEFLISSKTKLIAFSQPNNPTGSLLDPAHRKILLDLCEKYSIPVLCDEVYRMEESSLSDESDLVIATGSLSKMYGAAGLRCGWIRADEKFLDLCRYTKDYHFISAGTLGDALGIKVLKDYRERLSNNQKYLRENKRLIYNWLKEHPQFEAQIFDSGSSMLLKIPQMQDEQYALDLMADCSLLVVPGSFFSRPGYVRVGLGGLHKEELMKALKLLEQFQEKKSIEKI